MISKIRQPFSDILSKHSHEVYTVNIMDKPEFWGRWEKYAEELRSPKPRRKSLEAPRDENEVLLEQFCAMLNIPAFEIKNVNGKTRYRLVPGEFSMGSRSLRDLLKEWKESGPNMEIMKANNPDLWHKIERVTVEIKPTTSGAVQIKHVGVPAEEKGLSREERLILGFFLMLILNPLYDRLGGPCVRCGKFYIKKTKRQKVYCSKQCGLLKTSIDCNRRSRLARHHRKVLLAQSLMAKWQKSGTRRDWKHWVSSKSKHTITANWLTRALNKGQLSEPH